MIRNLDPALVTLAHGGTKADSETYDRIHRHEANARNAVWQADHPKLDIWLTARAKCGIAICRMTKRRLKAAGPPWQ